jgi:hypothetical protein
MEGHDERAQELEYELADMEKQQDDLDDSIHAAKEDWEAKKRDESVPGAGTGDEPEEPEATGEGEPEVEDETS